MAAEAKAIRRPARASRGGFAVGLIVGLLVGLAVALVVALWVTKAPVPFVNKLPQRGADQDAAEAERNKNWDPNAPLAGKSLAKPASPGGTATELPSSVPAASAAAASAPPAPATATATAAPPAPAAAPRTGRDPAAILAGQADPAPRAPPRNTTVPAQVGLAPALNPAAAAAQGLLQFYVQAGAYARPDDADAQRARVAMLGMSARVMAREQAGKTVYRVRVGPFDDRTAAEDSQSRLTAAGIEASLVRVER